MPGLKEYYDFVVERGGTTKNFADWTAMLNESGKKRKEYYDFLSERGLTSKNYNDFSSYITNEGNKMTANANWKRQHRNGGGAMAGFDLDLASAGEVQKKEDAEKGIKSISYESQPSNYEIAYTQPVAERTEGGAQPKTAENSGEKMTFEEMNERWMNRDEERKRRIAPFTTAMEEEKNEARARKERMKGYVNSSVNGDAEAVGFEQYKRQDNYVEKPERLEGADYWKSVAQQTKDTEVENIQRHKDTNDVWGKLVEPMFVGERRKAVEKAESQYMKPYGGFATPDNALGLAFNNSIIYEKYNDPARIIKKIDNKLKVDKEYQNEVTELAFKRIGIDTSKSGKGNEGGNSPMLTAEEEKYLQYEVSKISNDIINRMYDYYKKENAPKGTLDYIVSGVANDNMFSSLMEAVRQKVANSSGLREQLRQQMSAQYGSNIGINDGFGGTVGRVAANVAKGGATLATDVALMNTVGFGSGLLTKAIAKAMPRVATGVATRAIMKTAPEISRYQAVAAGARVGGEAVKRNALFNTFVRALGTSSNLAIFESAGEAINTINLKDENGRELSTEEKLKRIGEKAVHGAEMGVLLGGISGALAEGTKYASVGTKVGADIAGLGIESTLFATSQMYEKAKAEGKSVFDGDFEEYVESIGTNFFMFGAMRMAHIKDMKTRYTTTAKKYGMELDENNMKELRNAGYSNVFEALNKMYDGKAKRYNLSENQGTFTNDEGETSMVFNDADGKEIRNGFEQMMQDTRLSIETKRKIKYLADGTLIKPSAVMDVTTDANNLDVVTYDALGNWIETKSFKSEKERDAYFEKKEYERMVNTVSALEGMSKSPRRVTRDAIRMASKNSRLSEADIERMCEISDEILKDEKLKIYDENGNEVSHEDVKSIKSAVKAYAESIGQFEGEDMQDNARANVKAKTGVDVKDIFEKEKLSKKEATAVDMYISELRNGILRKAKEGDFSDASNKAYEKGKNAEEEADVVKLLEDARKIEEEVKKMADEQPSVAVGDEEKENIEQPVAVHTEDEAKSIAEAKKDVDEMLSKRVAPSGVHSYISGLNLSDGAKAKIAEYYESQKAVEGFYDKVQSEVKKAVDAEKERVSQFFVSELREGVPLAEPQMVKAEYEGGSYYVMKISRIGDVSLMDAEGNKIIVTRDKASGIQYMGTMTEKDYFEGWEYTDTNGVRRSVPGYRENVESEMESDIQWALGRHNANTQREMKRGVSYTGKDGKLMLVLDADKGEGVAVVVEGEYDEKGDVVMKQGKRPETREIEDIYREQDEWWNSDRAKSEIDNEQPMAVRTEGDETQPKTAENGGEEDEEKSTIGETVSFKDMEVEGEEKMVEEKYAATPHGAEQSASEDVDMIMPEIRKTVNIDGKKIKIIKNFSWNKGIKCFVGLTEEGNEVYIPLRSSYEYVDDRDTDWNAIMHNNSYRKNYNNMSAADYVEQYGHITSLRKHGEDAWDENASRLRAMIIQKIADKSNNSQQFLDKLTNSGFSIYDFRDGANIVHFFDEYKKGNIDAEDFKALFDLNQKPKKVDEQPVAVRTEEGEEVKAEETEQPVAVRAEEEVTEQPMAVRTEEREKVETQPRLAEDEGRSDVEKSEEKSSVFGTIFRQFRGKTKSAIDFLLNRGEGKAIGALHHKDVGDIDLWYGNDKAGLKKIANKHPEVLDDLQGILDDMHIFEQSENRIKLESDTHLAVISRDWMGEKTDNWLLTAYEKKEKGSSVGSMDIDTEPEGKQNGTAPLQTSISEGKGTNNIPNNQTFEDKNVVVAKKKYDTKHEKMLKEMGTERYDTLEEFVLRQMGGGKTKFRWKAKQSGTGGLGTHTTGEGARGDMMAKASMLDAVNGTTPEEYAEHIMDDLPDNLSQYDVMDVADAVIDALRNYNGFNQMVEAAYDIYNSNIEKDKQAEMEGEEEARDQWAQDKGFADYNDFDLTMKARRKQMEVTVAKMKKPELEKLVDDYKRRVNEDARKQSEKPSAKNMRAWVSDWESLKVAENALANIDKYSEEEGWFGAVDNKKEKKAEKTNEQPMAVRTEEEAQPRLAENGGEKYVYRRDADGRKVYTIEGADGKVRLSSWGEFAKARKAKVPGVPTKEDVKRIDDEYRLGLLVKRYGNIKNAEEAEMAYEAVSRQIAEGNYDEDAIGSLKIREKELKELSELMNAYPTEDGEVQFMVGEDGNEVYGKQSGDSKVPNPYEYKGENWTKSKEKSLKDRKLDQFGVPLRTAQEWLSDEARQESMARHADDKDMARKSIAFLSDASKQGVKFTYEQLMSVPEIAEAQAKIKARGKAKLEIKKKEVEKLANKLLDAEHGSFTHKEKNADGKSVEIFDGEVRQEKKAFIIIGRPAGGKSSVYANPLSKANKARIIDSDVVKPWLEGYDDGDGAGYVQDASAKVADKALAKATAKGDNIVLPKIGGPSVLRMAYNLNMEGYDVQMYYNDVSEEASFTRSMARFAETGRFLDMDYLNDIKDKPYITMTVANKGIGAILKHLAEDEINSNKEKGLNNTKWQKINEEYEKEREIASGIATDAVSVGRYEQGRELVRERGGISESKQEVPERAVQEEVNIFSKLEWKNNDVKIGEKTEHVWDSQSGKTFPTPTERKVAKAVRTDNFKAYFGDWENEPKKASKVVDSEGKPMVVYHATPYYGFSTFNTKRNKHGERVIGAHFGTEKASDKRILTMGNRADAKRVGTYSVFLNIRNPWECGDWFDMNDTNIISDVAKLVLKNKGNKEIQREWDMVKIYEPWMEDYTDEQLSNGYFRRDISSLESYEEDLLGELYGHVRNIAKACGYDGIKYQNKVEGDVSWVAFEPEQIKSIDNNGNFGKDEANIYMMIGDDVKSKKGMRHSQTEASKAEEEKKRVMGAVTKMVLEENVGKDNVVAMDEKTSREEFEKVVGKAVLSSRNTMPLEERVSGDKLLNTQDLIEEVIRVGGEVDNKGYITLYHRGTEEEIEAIKKSDIMKAKENGLFFSTSKDGQNNSGYGDAVIAFKVPAEECEIDDIFSDEASIRIPLKGKKLEKNVSDWIVNDASMMISPDGEAVEKPGQVFYSNAERALGEIQQKKGSGEQWINMLKNKGGLKAEEDKWIGLSEWLKGKKSVSKDEILEYINENKLEVVDVNYAEGVDNSGIEYQFEEELKDALQAEFDEYVMESEEMDPEQIYMSYHYDYAMGKLFEKYGDDYINRKNANVVLEDYEDIKKLQGLAKKLGVEMPKMEEEPINDTRLMYTTEGLENKREIALVVPTIEQYNKRDEVHFGDAGEGRAVAWLRMGDAETVENKVSSNKEIVAEHERAKDEFDKYFDDMVKKYNIKDAFEMIEKMSQEELDRWNELDEKTNELFRKAYPGGGERVLVIDEVQSKRHQDGREKGYKDDTRRMDEALRKFEERRDELAGKWNTQELSKVVTPEEYEELKALWKNYIEERDKIITPETYDAVPDAPFRNNWHELAMKRALRYAVENGYDKLAWTSGEQQARRYDIGGVVPYINIRTDLHPVADERARWKTLRFEADGRGCRVDINTDGKIILSEGLGGDALNKNVTEVFGKEVGQMIMNSKTDDRIILEGRHIGGEGMKGFYDKMLPSFMGKYVKKWGGKVGEVELRNVEKDAQKMWSVDITDEMRKSVMEGQPQFFTDKRGKVYGWAKDGKIYLTDDGVNANTPVHEYTHLWAEAVMKKAPELWKSIKELLKGCSEWKKVMSDKNYRNIWGNEDKVASEVLSRLSGSEHERRMSEEYDKMMAEADGDIVEEAKINRLFRRMKEAVNKFWEWVGKNLFGIKKFKDVEDVVNRTIYDYYKGTDLKSGEVPGGQRNVNDVANEAKNRAEELKNKYKGQKTEDILVSLSDKNGEIDYEKAREIGRRVAEGEVRVKSEDGRKLVANSGELSQAIQAIFRGRAKANAAQSRESGLYDSAVQRSAQEISEAERAAKELGAWYDEGEIPERLTNGEGVVKKGSEAKVYRSEDGGSAIKVIEHLDQHSNSIARYLRDLDAFNAVFPYSKCEVVGFTKIRTRKGDVVCPIVKQEWKEGVTALEWAKSKVTDNYPFAENDYADGEIQEWMEVKGYEYTDDYSCFENEDYLIEDLHSENVIVDKDGTYDAIDAYVRAKDDGMLEGYEYEDVETEGEQPMAVRSEEERKKDEEYMRAVESGDMKKAQEMVLAKADEQLQETLLASDADEKGFKYHRGVAPKKVRKMYAVLNVNADGLHAAYAGNKGATPVGVWLDAQNLKSYVSDKVFFDDGTPVSYIPGDTGKSTKEAGIDPASRDADAIGKSWLLERGGKHGSDVPNFSQMNTATTEDGRKTSKKQIEGALPSNKLVFEIECGMDEDGDLTEYVKENGRMLKGKNQGLAKIEPNKFYFFKTNPNAVGNWGLAGTFRVMRLVPHDEIVSATEEYKRAEVEAAKKAFEDGDISKKDMAKRVKNAEALQVQKWIGGYHPENYGLSVEMVDKMYEDGKRMKLTDAVTYDDNGEVIPLSERFNSEVEDARFMIELSEDGNREMWEKGRSNLEDKLVLVKDGIGAVTYGSDARKVGRMLGKMVFDGRAELSGGEVMKLKKMMGDEVAVLEYGDKEGMSYKDNNEDWDKDYTSKKMAEKVVMGHPEAKRLREEIKNAKSAWLVDGQEGSKRDLVDAVEDYSAWMQRLAEGDVERNVSKGARAVFAEEVKKAEALLDAIEEGREVLPKVGIEKKEKKAQPKKTKKSAEEKNNEQPMAVRTEERELIGADKLWSDEAYSVEDYVGHEVDFSGDRKDEVYSDRPYSESEGVFVTMLPEKWGWLNGNTVTTTGQYYDGNRQEIAHSIKNGDETAIREAAVRMAQPMREAGMEHGFYVLVPIPGHNGSADETLRLANEIGKLLSLPVADVLKGKARGSQYDAKKKGELIKAEDMGMEMIDADDFKNSYDDSSIILVDSVIASGETARAAHKAVGGDASILAFAEDFKGDSYEIGKNSVTLSLEDSERVKRQRESMPKVERNGFGAWSDANKKLVVQSAKIKQRFPELWDRAKNVGDVEDAWKIGELVVKPEVVAKMKSSYPDAMVVYPHRAEDVGQNKLASIYAEWLRKMGLDVDDGIVMTERAFHTGASRLERLVRRARYDGEVKRGQQYIIVDDHTTSGATMRDMKDYIESKGGEVVLMTALSASRGGTFLQPRAEDIDKLKKLGVTDEQVRNIGIANSIEDLTSREVGELINIARKGKGQVSGGAVDEVSSGRDNSAKPIGGGNEEMAEANEEPRQEGGSDRPRGEEIGYVEGARNLQDIADNVDMDDEYDIIELARRLSAVRKKNQRRMGKANKYVGKNIDILNAEAQRGREENERERWKDEGAILREDGAQTYGIEEERVGKVEEKVNTKGLMDRLPKFNWDEEENNTQPMAERTEGEKEEEKTIEQPMAERTEERKAEPKKAENRGSEKKAEKKAVQGSLAFSEEEEKTTDNRQRTKDNGQRTTEEDEQPVAVRTEEEKKAEPKRRVNSVKGIAEELGVECRKIPQLMSVEDWRALSDASFVEWQNEMAKKVDGESASERKARLDEAVAKHRERLSVLHEEQARLIRAIDKNIEKVSKNGSGLMQDGLAELGKLYERRNGLRGLLYGGLARLSESEMDKMDDALDYAKFAQKRNHGIEAVEDFEQKVRNSALATYALNTPEEVEMLRKSLPGFVVDNIKRDLEDATCGGAYIPSMKVAIVYPQKLKGKRDIECKVAHENSHYAIDMLRIPLRDMERVLDYIRNNRSDIYAEVSSNYALSDQPEEAVTHLIESLVEDYGLDAILNSKLQCKDEIVNKVINAIIDFWKNEGGYKYRPTNTRTNSEEQGVLGEGNQMRNLENETSREAERRRAEGLAEEKYLRAVVGEDEGDDPRPEFPILDDGENLFDDSYAEKIERYREALEAWKSRNREAEERRVEDVLFSGDAEGARATGVEALDAEALDEAERFDEMMHGAKIDVTMKGIKSMLKDEFRERRRMIETSNWEDAVLVHNIKKATTEEQRKQIPFLLEDPDEAKLYPELTEVLTQIREWFDEVHALMKEGGLFTRKEHDDYINNYCTHIWDFDKSEPTAVADFRNWIRTNSPYTNERVIPTLKEGIEQGMKPKYEDITDIMMEYGHYATEAVANRRLINFLKGFRVDNSPILVDDTTRDPDFVRIDNNALDGLKVHKRMKPLLDVVFGKLHTSDNVPLQNMAHIYDVTSGVQKKINLSLSFFHHGALTETALSMMGIPKFGKALFKNMIWDASMQRELPAFLDTDATMDAVKHFVSLGATQDYAAKEVNNLTAEIRKFFTDRKIYGLREGAVMADWVNRGMDFVLWDWLHDGYKIYSFKKIADEIRTKAEKQGWSDDKTEQALDEAGQLVNDTFGGQHWDLLGWSPNTVKWARRLLLSPDWTISTIRQALSPFGIGQLYNDDRFWKKWFRKDDVANVRKKYGRIFWLNAALVFIPFYNLLNAYFRKKDEDEELAKAKEIRKGDKTYKSAYELAYPNGMKWYDYTMLGNTLGHNTHLFAGRYANGTEMYVRWGKQFRELPELFFGRDGFSIPGPMIDKMAGKLNPLLNTSVNMISGYSLTGWSNPFMKNRRGWEKEWGRLQTLITSFTPYSIPTDQEKEFVWSDLMMPSTKGYSAYKAKSQFETAIKSGDIDLVGKVYEACVKNGLDANELYESAVKGIEATAKNEIKDGATDINTAVKMYDKAEAPAEREQLRNKIKKLMGAQNWSQIERSELMEKAESLIDGDVILKGSSKRYDMINKADDVIEDWRLSKAIAGLRVWEDERNEIKDAEGKEQAKLYELSHRDVFKKLKELRRVQRQIGNLKKRMGHGDDEADKEMMERIRKIRREVLEK